MYSYSHTHICSFIHAHMHACTSSSGPEPSKTAGSPPTKPPSHGKSFITLEDKCFMQIVKRFPDMPPSQYSDDILQCYNDLLHAAAGALHGYRNANK